LHSKQASNNALLCLYNNIKPAIYKPRTCKYSCTNIYTSLHAH